MGVASLRYRNHRWCSIKSRRRVAGGLYCGLSWLSLTLWLAVVFLAPCAEAQTICPNSCSGHGTCDVTQECSCFNGFTGADCSERECPSGAVWFAPPTATDVGHTEQRECSNAGNCDRATGVCTCDSRFEGAACERLRCPTGGTKYQCSGHGRCLTMLQIAEERNDYNMFTETTYSAWDANRVQGCACDSGWTSYDCSERVCVSGDDPMTGNQVDEIQSLACLCGAGECSGSFRLSFRGDLTAALSPTATASDLETALEDLQSIGDVSVSLSNVAQGICDPENTANVQFLTEHGDLPPIRVAYNGLSSNSASTDYLNVTESQVGTKENLECNGRGACSANTGACTCDALFESSDGQGNAGYLGDCGFTPNNTVACPVDSLDGTCSGHGKCNVVTQQCECYNEYSGYVCQKRSCPMGVAWFDEASQIDTAHAEAECSNRGTCNRVAGTCTCSTGFEGAACERMSCPTSIRGLACNGHGRCRSMYSMGMFRKLNGVSSPLTYGSNPGDVNTWDAHKIHGCDCDVHYHEYPDGISGDVSDWTGYDCSIRTCPTGDSPYNAKTAVAEVQAVKCETTNDSAAQFTLSFRDETTEAINGDVDATSIKAALEALSTIGSVDVQLADSSQNACGDGSQNFTVTFLTELGVLPQLQVTAGSNVDAISVSVVTSTTTNNYECALKGICDRNTGLCECFDAYVSSDGFGNRGTRGDCGYLDRGFYNRN